MQGFNQKNRFELPEFTVIHRPRVKKRLHLELDESGGLVVVAPRHWPKRQIRKTLERNASRVVNFLSLARKRNTKSLRFIQGEEHFYLGQRYPLSIHEATGSKIHVELIDGELRVHTLVSAPDNIRTCLYRWYRNQAAGVFDERMAFIAGRADWAKGRDIPLKPRRMKRTWGNCSAEGVIKLNTQLVKAPLDIIDSVIAHELCHLVEMNHSRAFYSLLERLNPGWREDRARLRSEGHIYLNWPG